MNTIHRIARAAQEGRMLSALQRRLDPAREWNLRTSLRQQHDSARELPSIEFHGNFEASPASTLLKSSFEAVQQGRCMLTDEIRDIEGMSGQKYRSFINNLVSAFPDPRYLEIGSWAGSTATAALYGNTGHALCIDNWSQFGGPRSEFFSNMQMVVSDKINFKFLEKDYRSIDFSAIGQFNIYLFDGPHKEADHYEGITLAKPSLLDPFVLIVDDWNWRSVRVGTFRGLHDAQCHIESSIEIRTTRDNTHGVIEGKASDWHNGYFLAVVLRN